MKSKSKAPGKSHRKGLTLLELTAMFPTEQAARSWFESVRWGDQRYCPHCGSTENNYSNRNDRPMPYHCGECRQHFSVKTGTVMQSSKLGLQKWAFGIYLLSTNLKGVSSMKLHRDLGITQKSAWMMAQKIREGWLDGSDTTLSGKVEVDEVYIGGRERNKHESKKLKAGRGAVGKASVVGAKSRISKQIRAKKIESTDQLTLRDFIEESAERGSTIYTDEHGGHSNLPDLFNEFSHSTVKHSVGEYAKGEAHVNGIESFWAMLKRGYKGVYHSMSAKHLQRYITEFAGRHNVRDLDTLSQMALLVKGMENKRLTWSELTR